MLGSIRDIVIAVVSFIVLFATLIILFIIFAEGRSFDYQNFNSGLAEFKVCASNYDEINSAATQVENNEFIRWSDKEVEQFYTNNEFASPCNSSFTTSNEEQIREYAYEALDFATDFYKEQAYLIDAVYTAPSSYYAFIGKPQEYLYFALPKNQEQIVGVLVQQGKDGLIVTNTWELEDTINLKSTEQFVKLMLVKYSEKVI